GAGAEGATTAGGGGGVSIGSIGSRVFRIVRLQGLDARRGGSSSSVSTSPLPTAEPAGGAEIEAATARTADRRSADSDADALGEGAVAGRWKKCVASPADAVAATPISSR